ncbi:hypothetical protein LTR10_017135 [Elasticomyces elasticus]|uniref:Major facilitator superfamily (MFS) profile domain-containing protein n=1 Tax=Exophiala sideris TaxID=1016849 RepID=A0ABR0JE22_9EURO|nr:hypothetical protein LTR10_017135 [Elasticomyces elasticus]KAK5032568.1 hypothetical protein LTS07_003977 [Exophiala sideris]KAK5037252.1 hypothetical protein LTR13_005058 [Exophiala sideris]KAK5062093.1 hypothetical protein LTR69_004450 [Exophiala sideris]KAK5182410.1 hypothetical protein LTR44_005422 [Eurotiomycetes sp. CCFEE 6388]
MSSTEKPVQADAISSHRESSDTQRDGYVRMEPSDLEKVMSKHEDGDVAVTVEVTTDPNVINWNGPDDPENPLNWPASKKWTNIAFLSAITFLTPFASSTFAPGVPLVMEEFNEDSVALASFVVSVYVLGYVFGPLVVAPCSELYGRLPVYHVNTFLFLAFTIGCARSTSIPMLIVFRFLAGVAGSSPITVGSGSIADTFRQEERGKVMSIWSFPILFGPSLGPVVGSYLSEAAGWRWDFYLLAILTAVLLVLTAIFQRETYPPVLLERKAARLRKETGNEKLRSALQSPKSPRELFFLSIVRPLKMLFRSPIVFGLSLYIAVTYGYLYLMFTTITFVFEDQYGISASNVGLVFLGIGLGQLSGLAAFGACSDRLLKKWAKGGALKAEHRLPLLWPGAALVPIGLLIYGWSAQYAVHWIVPLIGTFIFGAGMIMSFMPVGTYLVDAYTTYAASAMAANTVLRSIGGAFLPLAGRNLADALGLGWGNTMLAFICIALSPMIWFFNKYGERIRNHPRFKLNL